MLSGSFHRQGKIQGVSRGSGPPVYLQYKLLPCKWLNPPFRGIPPFKIPGSAPGFGRGDQSLLIVSIPTISVQLVPMVYQAILCYNVHGGVERHKEVSFVLK